MFLSDFNIPKIFMDPKSVIISYFLNIYSLKQYNRVTNNLNRIFDLVIAEFPCDVIRDTSPMVPENTHYPSLNITFHHLKHARSNQTCKQKSLISKMIIYLCMLN